MSFVEWDPVRKNPALRTIFFRFLGGFTDSKGQALGLDAVTGRLEVSLLMVDLDSEKDRDG